MLILIPTGVDVPMMLTYRLNNSKLNVKSATVTDRLRSVDNRIYSCASGTALIHYTIAADLIRYT